MFSASPTSSFLILTSMLEYRYFTKEIKQKFWTMKPAVQQTSFQLRDVNTKLFLFSSNKQQLTSFCHFCDVTTKSRSKSVGRAYIFSVVWVSLGTYLHNFLSLYLYNQKWSMIIMLYYIALQLQLSKHIFVSLSWNYSQIFNFWNGG